SISAHPDARKVECFGVSGGSYESFFLASSGMLIFVEPTSLISTVVVRSMSRSSPLKVIVPETLYSYLESLPSLTQNLTDPEALPGVGALPSPPPPRPPLQMSDR